MQQLQTSLRRHAWHARPQAVFTSNLGRATASSSSSDGKPSWQRRTRTWAKLTADEWLERCVELQERSEAWLQQRAARGGSFSANDFLERSHYRWHAANDRFDNWFNKQWPIWEAQMRRRLQTKHPKETSQPQKVGPPFDIPAVLLIGSGVGSLTQGWAAGVVLAIWGTARGISRFIVQRVDAEDREGLFRWAPTSWGPAKRAEMFNWLEYQIHVHRKRREGDPYYTSYHLHHGGKQHKAMDPLNDYTPEKLFDDAMESVGKHPRILEALGGEITDVAEPDKVIYRIVEGIAEVCLAWRITGPTAEAEIQVKSTACLLDYIYVFPESTGRYQMTQAGFVIRPHGDWSQNADELPRYMKRPFGKEGDSGRLFHNRTGIFEYDWTMRDFKHGKENMSAFGGPSRS